MYFVVVGVGVQLLKCELVKLFSFEVGCSWKYGLGQGCMPEEEKGFFSGCGHLVGYGCSDGFALCMGVFNVLMLVNNSLAVFTGTFL